MATEEPRSTDAPADAPTSPLPPKSYAHLSMFAPITDVCAARVGNSVRIKFGEDASLFIDWRLAEQLRVQLASLIEARKLDSIRVPASMEAKAAEAVTL